jgi:eukaryotic-like serine/threonine-protein kinase
MAYDLAPPQANDLINGRFAVDTTKPLPAAGGGLTAFVARDRFLADAPRVAISVSRDSPPRIAAIEMLSDPIENLMMPIGHGLAPTADGKSRGYFVVCTPPPGAPLSEHLERWTDRALVDLVLRPIAQALDALRQLRIAHRAIRLNNVFQAAPGQPVTLGAAWAAPPAWHQPSVYEPLYSAMCHHAGRGEGTPADDIYALGVLLLTLAGGKVPLASMDDAELLRLRIEHGSFAALVREFMPAGVLGDLLRSMLADDPDHRPSPRLLLDTAAARGRRVAARPPRRSARPLKISEINAFDSRMLAYALAIDDKKSIQLLRSGQVSQWLRRDLGDAGLAAQIEELVRSRLAETHPNALSDPLLIMQVVTTINPRMPLAWRGVLLWPDSLPGLIGEAICGVRELMVVAEDLATTDIISRWSTMPVREGRGEIFSLPPEAIAHRQPLMYRQPGGLLRLFYGLNPMLPCRAKQVADAWVVSVPELIAGLEKSVSEATTNLIDLPVATFISARAERKFEPKVAELILNKNPESFRLQEIDLLRELQTRYHPAPLPRISRWMAERVRPDLQKWQNRPKREVLSKRLTELGETGNLTRVLTVAQDHSGLAADQAGARSALAELRKISIELQAVERQGAMRLTYAERAGHAITGGLGLAVFILMFLRVLVP